MKRSLLASLVLVAAGLIALGAGCAQPILSSYVARAHPHTFALAVTVAGGGQPTPAQWAAIKHAFENNLLAYDGELIDDYRKADAIIRVQFNPGVDENDLGTASILGIRRNPTYSVSSSSAFASSASFMSNPGAANQYYNSYFGYGYNYSDYY